MADEIVYPTGVKVFIDDVDVTMWLFDQEFIALSDINNTFRNIDITPYLVGGAGDHLISVQCDDGVGRVEIRLEIE